MSTRALQNDLRSYIQKNENIRMKTVCKISGSHCHQKKLFLTIKPVKIQQSILLISRIYNLYISSYVRVSLNENYEDPKMSLESFKILHALRKYFTVCIVAHATCSLAWCLV